MKKNSESNYSDEFLISSRFLLNVAISFLLSSFCMWYIKIIGRKHESFIIVYTIQYLSFQCIISAYMRIKISTVKYTWFFSIILLILFCSSRDLWIEWTYLTTANINLISTKHRIRAYSLPVSMAFKIKQQQQQQHRKKRKHTSESLQLENAN